MTLSVIRVVYGVAYRPLRMALAYDVDERGELQPCLRKQLVLRSDSLTCSSAVRQHAALAANPRIQEFDRVLDFLAASSAAIGIDMRIVVVVIRVRFGVCMYAVSHVRSPVYTGRCPSHLPSCVVTPRFYAPCKERQPIVGRTLTSI